MGRLCRTFPFAVTRTRFLIPLWLFILGILRSAVRDLPFFVESPALYALLRALQPGTRPLLAAKSLPSTPEIAPWGPPPHVATPVAGRLYCHAIMDSPPGEHDRGGSTKAWEDRPPTPIDGVPTQEHPAIPHDLYCQQCGYNLRGLTSERCPECGRSLEGLRATVSRIPWVHRREIGWFRAYRRTVWMAMFRHHRLCDEMARPVSYRDSQSFRWVTILHAYVPILAMTIAAYTATPFGPFDGELLAAGYRAIWPVLVVHVCVLLFLAAATGVPSYFFHPRDLPVELQNRAVALSYYTCGPLAITILPVLAAMGNYALTWDHNLGAGLGLLAITLPCALFAVWFFDLCHLAGRILPHNRTRAYLVAVCVPLLWFCLAWLMFCVVPIAAFTIALFIFETG